MKTSKMLIMSYMGDHVWLMTSRHTEPELQAVSACMYQSWVLCKLRGCYSVQFIDVGVEYPVHEADARAFVRVLIGQLDVDLPEAALKRCCILSERSSARTSAHTVFWALEPDVELLPTLCQCCGWKTIGR
jgi:hypothetical protein